MSEAASDGFRESLNVVLRTDVLPDIEPAIYRHRMVVECRLNVPTIARSEFREFLLSLSAGLRMNGHPEFPEPVITSATGCSLPKHAGLEAMLFWLESGLHAYWWETYQLLTIDLHSCVRLNKDTVTHVIEKFFPVVEIKSVEFVPTFKNADNVRAEVRTHNRHGQGVFARERIVRGEFIAGFYGKVYQAQSAMELPKESINHAIQFSENRWRDSDPCGLARYLNHSCNPNCGISGLFDLVAIKDIGTDDELCWDYAMTEDSDWRPPGGVCTCGEPQCKGTIFPYGRLSQEKKEAYQAYTSAWILRRYHGK